MSSMQCMDDMDYQRPILTVDVALFTLIDNRLHILLTRRPREPYSGSLALIGGYIHTDEDGDTHAAARRVSMDKIGVDVSHAEQLAMFSGPDRDPRGWSATIAYIAMIRKAPMDLLKDFYLIDNLPKSLAFDHEKIIHWAVCRIRNKASYSTLPLFLMEDEFTLLELQTVYEMLLQQIIDKATFRRRIKDMDLIEPTGHMSDSKITKCRPAEQYRLKQGSIHFFNHGFH